MRSLRSFSSSAHAIAASLIVFGALACGDRAGTSGGNETPGAPGGTMVIAQAGTGLSPLVPPLIVDIVGRQVTDNIFERLADIGASLNTVGDQGFQPRLAKSWTWSTDSMSVAFALDPRARWHDGQPVRASDVRFSLDLGRDPKTGSTWAPLLTNVDSITVRDSLTAVAWFHKRTPEQFYELTYNLFVMPEHVLGSIPRDKLATSEFATKPVGSGQFRLARVEPSVRVEVVADTAHYRGRPKLDRVIWSLNPDAGAAITKLMSGEADVFENLPPAVLAQIDSNSPVRPVRYAGLQYAFMGFNHRDPKRPASPHPIFGDARVRRAISVGLDRAAMLKNIFDTLGTLGVGPYSTGLADTSVKPPAFDRVAAAALLDSAGWKAGADGMRSKGGRPLAFTLMVPTSSSFRMRYAVLIQEQLKALGIKADIESLEINAFLQKQTARTFDAALMGAAADPSPGAMKQSWATAGMAKGGQNYLAYSNPVFDALIDSTSASFDAAKSRQYYHRAIQTLMNDAPGVWLYDVLTMAGIHKRIRPVGMRADAWWASLPDWWIPESQRIDRDKIGLRAPTASTP